MLLRPGEPCAAPWRVVPLGELVRLLREAAGSPAGRPAIVAVDGRSAGGKSTLAERLHAAIPASAVVHTDDVAWHESYFEWARLLATGVLEPIRGGAGVDYRPPAWQTRGRHGGIRVPAGLDVVLVEGVGATQRALDGLVDVGIWVQSDFREAQRRGIARDIESGVNGDERASIAFWHEWMAEELRFLNRDRPWERAAIVVAGTPDPGLGAGPGDVVIADGPLIGPGIPDPRPGRAEAGVGREECDPGGAGQPA